MKHQWKWIPGFEGIYKVSSRGRVKSVDRSFIRNGKQIKLKGQLKTQTKDDNGYLRVGLFKNGKGRNYRVHTLVLVTFVGPCPEGMEARHLNGIKIQNNLSNLAWGTPQENSNDKRKHGAKISKDDVIMIKTLRTQGKVLREIGEIYGVSPQTIHYIVNH